MNANDGLDSSRTVAILEDALARARRGENPSLSDYRMSHPGLSPEVGEAIRAMTVLERMAGQAWSAAPLPERVGDFRIVRRIGSGGMAEVYEAIQETLGRRVAVKVLATGVWRDASDRERFRLEARAAARLHHSNIVPVYDIGDEGGVPYFAMQFIPGLSLKELIDDVRAVRSGRLVASGPFAWLTGMSGRTYALAAAGLVAQAADALAHAHAHGVVHRDVKPGNLMIEPGGTVWVTDFGLAKPTEGANLTKVGHVVGTARYLSPERFQGRSDPTVDVYGLGATLYELVTLRPVYDEDDPFRLLAQIRSGVFPRPRSLDAAIPADLETVLLKSIASDPADRYASAVDFAADLRRVVENRPVAARRHSIPELAWRWAKRKPAWASLVGVVLLGTAGLTALTFQVTRERNAAVGAERKTAEADLGRRRELAAALIGEARQLRRTGRLGSRRDAIAKITASRDALPESERTPEKLAELRDEAIACLAVPDGVEIARVPVAGAIGDVSATTDGREVTRTTSDGVSTFSLSGSPIRHWPAPTGSTQYTFNGHSRDGRWFLETIHPHYNALTNPLERIARVRVWDRAEGRLVHDRPAPTYDRGAAVTADGTLLVGGDGGRRIEEWPVGATAPRSVSPPRFAVVRVDLSPREDRLAVVMGPYGLDIVKRDGWVSLIRLSDRHVLDVAWHPDGRRLSFVTGTGRVIALDVESGELNELSPVRGGPHSEIHFSPDGRHLGVFDGHATTTLYDWDRRGAVLTVPGRLLRILSGPHFLVEEAGAVVRYALAGEPVVRSIPDPTETVTFRPDGAVLATSGLLGATLRSTATLDVVARLGLDSCGPVAWHPRDGRFATVGIFSGLTVWTPSADASALKRQSFAFNQSGPQHGGRAVCWADGGESLFVGDYRSGSVRRIDVPPTITRQESTVPKNIHHLDVSADGKTFLTASRSPAFCALYETDTGRLVRRWDDVLFGKRDPGGRRIVLVGDRVIRFVDSTTLDVVSSLPRDETEPTFGAASFTADGRLAAVGLGAGRVGLVDPETGALLARLSPESPATVTDIAFSPSGSYLAVSSLGQNVRLWSLTTLFDKLAEVGLAWSDRRPPETPVAVAAPMRVEDPFRPRAWAEQWAIKAFLETEAGKYPDAVNAASRALECCPHGDAEYRIKLLLSRAKCYLNNDDVTAALADGTAALQLAPSRDETLILLARTIALSPDRDPATALPYALAAAEFRSRSANATLGLVYARVGSRDKAVAKLEAASGEVGGSAGVLTYDTLAACHGLSGRPEKARDAFDAARRLERTVKFERLGLFDRAALARAKAEAERAVKRGNSK